LDKLSLSHDDLRRYGFSVDGNGRLELVAEGFSFPTSLTFDEAGVAYVAESGLPFGGAPPGGRVYGWSVDAKGTLEPVGSWDGVPATVAGLAAS
jgi:hypothetical protein